MERELLAERRCECLCVLSWDLSLAASLGTLLKSTRGLRMKLIPNIFPSQAPVGRCWSVGWLFFFFPPPIIHSILFSSDCPFFFGTKSAQNVVCGGYTQWNPFSGFYDVMRLRHTQSEQLATIFGSGIWYSGSAGSAITVQT